MYYRQCCFSDKSNNFESITVAENEWIISDDIKVANIFNNYFSNPVENLKLKVTKNLVNCSCQSEDSIFKPFSNFKVTQV